MCPCGVLRMCWSFDTKRNSVVTLHQIHRNITNITWKFRLWHQYRSMIENCISYILALWRSTIRWYPKKRAVKITRNQISPRIIFENPVFCRHVREAETHVAMEVMRTALATNFRVADNSFQLFPSLWWINTTILCNWMLQYWHHANALVNW